MQKKENSLGLTLSYLEDLIRSKKNSSNSSYTTKLIKGDINKVIQKVGEESTEVIIEATLKNKERTIYESADLLYHLLVMWSKLNINLEEIAEELNKRKK
jgi:phosphoribosyl-ATP pyrophosphohydrolase/phosphoribosyl-AMP cyclohydrolase|tara:strand:+ start:411 stop:710 length:300 start_codon:yes stop_codon:yes gene_type:complete